MNDSDKILIARILRESLQEPVLSIVPIPELGIVNRVFRVNCPNGEWILRMRESPLALQEFRKEAWCLKQAAKIGIPSPVVLAAGVADDTAYLVETCIPGMNGSLLPKPQPLLWEALGRSARLIEHIPATGFGMEFEENTCCDVPSCGDSCSTFPCCNNSNCASGIFRNSFTPTWEAHIRYNIDALGGSDRLLALEVYLPNQEETIRDAFFSLLAGMEAGRLRLGLLHGDLSPRNLILGPNGIPHLIDWGCALVHAVPHYGLACLLRSRLEGDNTDEAEYASFLKGYGLNDAAYRALETDIHRILLLDAFDKLRWALDRSPDDVPAFRTFATRMVARMDN